MAEPRKRFRAFISYSQKDKRHAIRLHRALEAYRIPKGVEVLENSARGQKLGRFFRDDEEMGAASDLGQTLVAALRASENLIVICSPSAARSQWVNEEILSFKKTGQSDRVFAVIVSGSPNTSAAADPRQRARECFPVALRTNTSPRGEITDHPVEPLGLDGRKEPFRRLRARLAASLLRVNFDDLWRRDLRRARKRVLFAAACGLAAVLILLASLGWFVTNQARRVSLERSARLSEYISVALEEGWQDRALRVGAIAARESFFSRASPESTFELSRAAREYRLEFELVGHTNDLLIAVYSPDGSRIVTGSSDFTARIWDAETGLQVSSPLQHDGIITDIEFAPDSRRFVTSSGDGSVQQWDAISGVEIGNVMYHDYGVSAVAYSPDGSKIATASADRIVKIWDATAGEPLVLPMRHLADVTGVAFSPNGARIATTSMLGEVRLWDAESGLLFQDMSTLYPDSSHSGSISEIVGFSADGKYLATNSTFYGNGTGKIFFWDAETGSRVGEPLVSQSAKGDAIFPGLVVTTGAFSPTEDATFAFAARGGDVQIWNISTQELQGDALHHDLPVVKIAYSPSGASLVTVTSDGMMRLWDLMTRERVGTPMRQQEGLSHFVNFSPDGRRMITMADDQARVWNVEQVRALSAEYLVDRVCADDLAGADYPARNSRGEATGEVASIRLISDADVEAVPLLRDRAGDDVCARPSFWEDAVQAIRLLLAT